VKGEFVTGLVETLNSPWMLSAVYDDRYCWRILRTTYLVRLRYTLPAVVQARTSRGDDNYNDRVYSRTHSNAH